MAGFALIVDGIFFSPRGNNEIAGVTTNETPAELVAAKTRQLGADVFGVTDETIRHLEKPVLVDGIKTK